MSLSEDDVARLDQEDRNRNWPVYWSRFWESSGIPVRHRVAIMHHKPFEPIQDRGGRFAPWIRAAMEYSIDPVEAMLMIGKPGCGKTLLACSVLYGAAWRYAVKQTSWYLVPEQPRIRFESIPHILQEIRGTYDGDGKTEAVIARASWADLAVLDDIGAESPTEWVRDMIYQIVDNRYTSMRPTVFTSNHSLTELQARLSERIVDRVVEMSVGNLHKIDLPSFRLEKAKSK